MAIYIKAVECAEIISEKLNIPLYDLVDVFAEIPTAEVAEVKQGEWKGESKIELVQKSGKIPVLLPKIHTQCSCCCHCFIMFNKSIFKYCPNCGARMDGTPKERGGEK